MPAPEEAATDTKAPEEATVSESPKAQSKDPNSIEVSLNITDQLKSSLENGKNKTFKINVPIASIANSSCAVAGGKCDAVVDAATGQMIKGEKEEENATAASCEQQDSPADTSGKPAPKLDNLPVKRRINQEKHSGDSYTTPSATNDDEEEAAEPKSKKA